MAEGEVSGEAEKDVEADREDPEDCKALHQVRISGIELRQRGVFRERLQQDWRCKRQENDDQEEGRVFLTQSQHELFLHHASATHKTAGAGQKDDDCN